MELKWLEDILALYECRSFSRAAEKRNVTQPAFSRRIRMFEHWVGEEIVDRSTQPVCLSDTMEDMIPSISNLVVDFYNLRNSIKMDSATHSVTFATQHSLAAGVFPDLLATIERQVKPVTVRLRTANFPECITLLEKGEVAFVLCYESVNSANSHSKTFDRILLGTERLLPVTAVDENGEPAHDPERQSTVKLMNYTEGTFLRDMVNRGRLPSILQDYTVENVCVSSLAIALKHLVLAGMGVAWLPESLVRQDIADARLQSLE